VSASETGALRAGENGVVSPTQLKRELDRAGASFGAQLARRDAEIGALRAKCERLERENANLVLKSRGVLTR
jgi:hypothetical protein